MHKLKTGLKFQCCNWSVNMNYKIPEFRVQWNLFKLSNVGASWVNIETGCQSCWKFFALGFPIVSSLAQRQIPTREFTALSWPL